MSGATGGATGAPFERTAASLDAVVAAARPRLEALGIVLTDRSNRSGRGWGAWGPTWGYDFVRVAELPPYTARIRASVDYAPVPPDTEGGTAAYAATWVAEAWQGVSPNFHTVEGAAVVGPERFAHGAFERLVLALLRRAAPAFPDRITNFTWPVFPDLPDAPQPVDHLAEVRAFHGEMVEPWTGPPVGCSAAEVDALEARLGWPLPLAYRQYLAFMGADHQGVFVGSDWFLKSATVNGVSKELAHMEVAYTPPGDTLEFMWHQGYIVGWFDLPAASDDPPVHFYSESAPGNRVVDYVRFTDLLLAELRHMSAFTRRRPRRGERG